MAVVLIAIGGWYFFGRQDSTSDLTLFVEASGGDPIEAIIGRELLISLEKMKTINLDTTFFSDPAFTNLEDFTVEIPKQPIGRRNPFAPIGE